MIKYVGKKHLNSNFYKQIILAKEGNDVKVKAVVDDRFKKLLTIKTDTKVITEQIEGLSDFEKVKEIVLYFLRNNKICSLEQLSDKIVIGSTSFRKLILQLDSRYKDLINIIFDKYQSDRLEFITKHCEKDVYIQCSYRKSGYYLVDNVVSVFCMVQPNGDIISIDKKFLKEYLKNIIDNSKGYIRTDSVFSELMYKMYIDGIKLSISTQYLKELLHDIYSWVFNRNYNDEFIDDKQYKLEGIK